MGRMERIEIARAESERGELVLRAGRGNRARVVLEEFQGGGDASDRHPPGPAARRPSRRPPSRASTKAGATCWSSGLGLGCTMPPRCWPSRAGRALLSGRDRNRAQWSGCRDQDDPARARR